MSTRIPHGDRADCELNGSKASSDLKQRMRYRQSWLELCSRHRRSAAKIHGCVGTMIIFIGLISLVAGPACPTARAELKLGRAMVDVTPRKLPVLRNGGFLESSVDRVLDPLHARCLVLDDGKSRIALVVVDSCMMPRDLCDAVKAAASQSTEIPEKRILISATHTHMPRV